MLQDPAPPVPPTPSSPPGQELTVTGSLDGWDAVLVLLGAALFVAVLLWPLVRALARRIEAGAADTGAELEELRARLVALESQQHRLAEVESRLDFAERLLAQHEPERLEP